MTSPVTVRPALALPVRPIALGDRVWRRTHIIGIIGPIDLPSPEQMRDVLFRLAAVAPGTRLLCTLEGNRSRWRRVPGPRLAEHIDRMVRTLPGPVSGAEDASDLVEHTLRTLAEDLPLRILLGRDHVLFEMSHLVGDGQQLDPIWAELLARAADGGVPRWAGDSGPRLALPRAIAATFGRDAGRLARVVRDPQRRAVAPPARAGTAAPARAGERGSTTPGGDITAAIDAGPTATAAGADGVFATGLADPGCVIRRSGPDLLREVRAARGDRSAGRSVAGILFAATWSAVEKAGLPTPPPGMWVLFDGRRYVPVPTRAKGNFVAGIFLEPEDPGDPAAISAAMREVIDSGRPVATMAAAAARQLVPVPRQPSGSASAAAPAPTLALNYLPRLSRIGELPWQGEVSERVLGLAPTPAEGGGMTVTLAELAGCLHVSATFDAALFDREAVRMMADLLCTDPLGLLR
ncbi:hypothetical protein [Frankia sp. AgB32]|uniref:hypothetical protein n=1 Tax=Frankia sp. AgB32 TaxID=631119 RepID=UPI00200EAC96|nr:hypothetical protein [Frankia sp. AgB32]MCK9893713.1 hypothetical protein [Frankia sp. AgB32]